MTMPEMARLLMITRDQVYNILNQKRNKGLFEFVYIADQRRITKESFERWHAGQEKYCKLCDRPESEIAAMERKQQEMEKPRLQVDETKEVFTLQEAAVLLDVTYKDVRKLVLTGELEAKKYGTKYLISKDDIKWFVFQREVERENQERGKRKWHLSSNEATATMLYISMTMNQPASASRNGKALVLWRMRSAGKPESNIGRNWAMWSFSSAIHWMTC